MMLPLTPDIQQSIRTTFILTLAFMVMVPIGTVTHECGHYLVATSAGAHGSVSYAYTSWDYDGRITPEMTMWFTAGGPLQTMITGTIGLFLVILYARNRPHLHLSHWTMIFMALFWLRQPANMISGMIGRTFSVVPGSVGDEIRLARYWNLPDMTIYYVTGVIGLAVLAYITFRIIPRHQRIPFLASGLVGGLGGAWLWFYQVGPWLMP